MDAGQAVDHCHVTGEVRGPLCGAALEYVVKWDDILQSHPPF